MHFNKGVKFWDFLELNAYEYAENTQIYFFVAFSGNDVAPLMYLSAIDNWLKYHIIFSWYANFVSPKKRIYWS